MPACFLPLPPNTARGDPFTVSASPLPPSRPIHPRAPRKAPREPEQQRSREENIARSHANDPPIRFSRSDCAGHARSAISRSTSQIVPPREGKAQGKRRERGVRIALYASRGINRATGGKSIDRFREVDRKTRLARRFQIVPGRFRAAFDPRRINRTRLGSDRQIGEDRSQQLKTVTRSCAETTNKNQINDVGDMQISRHREELNRSTRRRSPKIQSRSALNDLQRFSQFSVG